MSPQWLQKIKSKVRGSGSASPHTSLPPAHPRSTSSLEASTASLKEQLWNQAYDELKMADPVIVEAYEKLLSAELQGDRIDPTTSAENHINPTSQGRWHQMERLVQSGLQRTEKDAAIREKIGDGIRITSPLKAVIGKAVQAVPQAAIAWVGVAFALEILANPFTEPGIQRDGIAYVVSKMDWYWNLVHLLLDRNGAGSDFEGLRGQLEKHIVQLYQKLLLYQIKSVCLYYRSRVTVFFRDVIKLDDWAGKLDDIKAAEAAVQNDSDRFNSQKIRQHLQVLAATAELQLKELQGVTSAIQYQTRRQEEMRQDQETNKCLKDLSKTDPYYDKKRVEETKGGLLEDSYRWVVDHHHFIQWRNDPHTRLLWIRGDPGKGKTMLLCGIINELEKAPAGSPRPAYFFCQATDERLNSATAVLRGLLFMLVQQHPTLVAYVLDRYKITGKDLFEGANAWVAMSDILREVLADRVLEGRILVIDALDECLTDLQPLLDFISTTPSHAKRIVSSRNWPEIEEKITTTTHKVTLHLELNEESVSGAVRAYILHKVDKLAALKKYDGATRNTVQKYLIDNSNDTFLWVALVCEQLADEKVRKRHTLKVLETFPPGLKPLYGRMIHYISGSRDADLCREVLAIVSVVYRPVTLQELLSIVQSPTLFDDDFEAMEEVIRSCGSFLTLRGGIVYFVHQSAKDFLLDKAYEAFGQILPSGIAHQHHVIFSRSLEVLSRTLRRNIYEMDAPGRLIEDISSPDPNPLGSLKYSCIHWVDHLKDSNSADNPTRDVLQDNASIHNFFKYKYLYWLEALSLLRSMSQGVEAVQKLRNLTGNAELQELKELVQDGLRFVLYFKQCLESSPLQVYTAALLFSPTRSLIRRIYQAEAPSWIAVITDIGADWNACLQTLEGHKDSVNSVAFSPDGCRLASASDDKTVKLWDTATGQCQQTLEGHKDSVNSVAFSPDGCRLASASNDKTVKLWDTATGQCQQTLEGHKDEVNSVAFSPDGCQLASASYDSTVKLWDTATGQCQQTLEDHKSSVNSVAFSPDGCRLASASNDKTVKLWDTATGQCQQTLEGHKDEVNSVAFSPDGCQLASASDDKTIKLWNIATGQCQQTLEGHSRSIYLVVFSPDGSQLASASYDSTIKLWDIATGQCQQTLEGYTDLPIWCMSIIQELAQWPDTQGYILSENGVWIENDSQNILWLPSEYRGACCITEGSRIAIGCTSGRVLWLSA